MTRLAALLALPFLVFACGGETGGPAPAEKGAEEGALAEYEADSKADSWQKPTDHGVLLPGLRSSGTFDRTTLFHAWNVELGDSAVITLATKSSDGNLDTVAYLYRWNAEEEKWGRYIAKDDDGGEGVFSRIEKTATAGTYRLMVKAHKRALRGTFEVTLDCEGPGCAKDTPVDPQVGDVGYTAECADRITDVLLSEVTGSGYNYVAVSEIEQLPPLQRAAAQWFVQSALEWAGEDELQETELEIGSTDLVNGAIVDITTGADWSFSYAFDADGKLLIEYFHDQSPSATFYCGAEGEPSADEPDESCAGGMMNNLPHAAGDVSTIDPTDVPEDLAHVVAMGEAVYRIDTGLGADAQLTWTMSAWAANGYDGAAKMTIEAEDQGPISYLIGGDKWSGYVYFSEKGEELTARCLSVDDLLED